MRALTQDSGTLTRRLDAAIAIVVFLIFGWVAERHVGDSVFLEDQVDQLQNFESLLHLRPEGLWGAVMSGTTPPARALGPLGALMFGLPVAIGLGIDSIHFITSLLISIGAAAVFLVLRRTDRVFAWSWFLFFSAMSIVWWNAGLFWSNTLLLPAGLALLAFAASSLQRPSVSTLAFMALTVTFALQLHLIAVVAVPVVLVISLVTWKDARQRPARWLSALMLSVLALAAVGPYMLAESTTGFRNTRAIFIHLQEAGSGDRPQAIATAASTLAIAADPSGLFEWVGFGALPMLAVGAVVVTLVLFLLGKALRGHLLKPPQDKRADWVIFWLTTSALVAAVSQALFFVWTTRPLAGLHYVTLLSPFYPVALAALLSRVIPRQLEWSRVSLLLGAASLAFLLLIAPSLADRFFPPTTWSYKRITAALDALCAGVAVDTAEGSGFAAQLDPQYDGVLRYLMNRQLSKCRYQRGSPLLIAATQDGQYQEWRTVGGLRYHLEVVLPPGIARYRRWP